MAKGDLRTAGVFPQAGNLHPAAIPYRAAVFLSSSRFLQSMSPWQAADFPGISSRTARGRGPGKRNLCR
jgi:hypothetical protein